MGGIVRSVFGRPSYTPPPAPEPQVLPTVVNKAVTDVKAKARGKLGKEGRYETILTGGKGVEGEAATRKTILGG